MDTHDLHSITDAHRYHVEHRDAYGKVVDAWAGVCSHGDAMQRAARMIAAMFLGDVVSVELREDGRTLLDVVVG